MENFLPPISGSWEKFPPCASCRLTQVVSGLFPEKIPSHRENSGTFPFPKLLQDALSLSPCSGSSSHFQSMLLRQTLPEVEFCSSTAPMSSFQCICL